MSDIMTPAAPSLPPLIVSSDSLVQAFDTATGRPLWRKVLAGGSGYARLASTGEVVAVCVGQKAFILEVATGNSLSEVELWFDVQAALAEGDAIVLVGTRGLACFTRAGYTWGIRAHDLPGGLFDRNAEFWVENARGEPIAKLDDWVPWRGSRSDLGMALGRTVFQPDRDS